MHIENSNDSRTELLKLRSKCSKILAIKVNTPKSIAFIYTGNKKKLEGKTLKDVICNNNKKNRPNENVQECYRANLTTTQRN